MKRPLNEAEAFRAQELLMERATYGLDPAQAAELAALGADDDVSFDLAAAAIDIATLRIEELPAGVADKILVAASVARAQLPQTLAGVAPPRMIDTRELRSGESPDAAAPFSGPGAPFPGPAASFPGPGAPFPSPTGPSGPLVGFVVPLPGPGPGPAVPLPDRAPPVDAPVIPIRRSRAPLVAAWVAAAACFALAAGAVLWARGRDAGSPTSPSPAEARAALLASAPDAATLAWSLTGDPAASAASGDVVWSPSKQRGYMRFVGLAPNDPARTQYQLWIFDKLRDQAFPVDGGVFDVSSTGEVIVAISPKLRVSDATLFAVTVELPGGVVVSKRERIVVTAAPAQRG